MINYFSTLSAEVHAENAHWWMDPATGQRKERDKRETLCLIVSELMECMEGERKSLMDDHLPHRRMPEVELADAMIRLLDYIGAHKYNVDVALFRSFPSLPANLNNLTELPRYFRNRFFVNNGRPASQLLHMVQAICRVAELEDGNTVARDVESAILWFIMLVCDYCGIREYDLWGAIVEKRQYNKVRADHKNEARLGNGGKKW